MSAAEHDRFWSKVDRRGPAPLHRPEIGSCWLWQGSCNTAGYGHFRLTGQRVKVMSHRHAYALTHGPIPAGKHVLHACDERRCCNPAHLSLGTPLDNARDCDARNRRRPQPTAMATLRAIRDRELAADEAWRLP